MLFKFSKIDLVKSIISPALVGAQKNSTSNPARRVAVIPISGAFAKLPFALASESFFSVGSSVLDSLSTSAMGNLS